MKKKLTLLSSILAFTMAGAAAQSGDEADSCWQKAPEDSPNPIIALITIPPKMLYALTLLPRCLLVSIPKNEE